MKIRSKLIGTIVLGAALLAPVAQAVRPDDQAGLRGPGAIASTLGSAANHPDSRGDGARGPGAVAGDQRVSVRPDDRDGVRGPGAIGLPEYVVVHPDNRAGARGPGAVPTALIQPRSTGFDWGDALIGGLGGAGLALLLTGSAFVLMSQRNKVRAA